MSSAIESSGFNCCAISPEVLFKIFMKDESVIEKRNSI